MRALRVDKLTYAALEATLEEHAIGRGQDGVPVQRMLRMSKDEIGVRADALAAALNESGWTARVIDGMSTVGGGSAPGAELPTRLVEIRRRHERGPDRAAPRARSSRRSSGGSMTITSHWICVRSPVMNSRCSSRCYGPTAKHEGTKITKAQIVACVFVTSCL